MAPLLTLALWFAGLACVWWLWAATVEASEPARFVINVVFVLFGLFLVWFLLFGSVPSFMHFGPHHADGVLGY